MEELPGLELEVEGDLALQVGDPFRVACLKGAVLLLIRGKRVERGAAVALLVLLQVGHHMIPNKAPHQVQLKVVIKVESLTLICLLVCVIVVLVACVGKCAHELLLALQAQFREDSFFQVHLQSLDGVVYLHERTGLDHPRCRR